MNKITFIKTKKGDWTLVYWNGVCVAEGEVVTGEELMKSLKETFGINVEVMTKSDEWLEKHDGHMHETLEG